MHAMILNKIGTQLVWTELVNQQPSKGQIRLKVSVCDVCRTDLHVIELPILPITSDQEIVGHIDIIGLDGKGLKTGHRADIRWLRHTCGMCSYCLSREGNLCNKSTFTGYTSDGCFTTLVIADAQYAFPLVEEGSDTETLILKNCHAPTS